uniref:Uncharacterized protein n=1 Tax=Zea mays TaxID=4577 RepID=B6TVM9_MAIZE|nr:hypothetical protein [Zea mays]
MDRIRRQGARNGAGDTTSSIGRVFVPSAVKSRGFEESSWYLESQVPGEVQVVQEEPHNEEFDLI